jgi:polyhydroxybutyrate depolymerase
LFACALNVLLLAASGGVAVAGERDRAIAADGMRREFSLIVPDKTNGPWPLLIVLHGGGGGQAAARVRRYTRFDEWVGRENYAVAFPLAVAGGWNDGRRGADLNLRGEIDDVEFVAAMIEQLVSEGTADPARVFVTGASNGGMMAMRAACELGDKIAGIGVVIANLPVDWECRAKRVPAVFIHGTDDAFMPYEGGQVAAGKTQKDLGEVRSVDATIEVFKRANGCTGVKDTKTLDEVGRDKTAVVVTDYECADAALRQIEVQGGGHTWPGARESVLTDWVLGNTSEEVNATAEIWNFFKAQER